MACSATYRCSGGFGSGGAMGDDMDPVAALIAQVNRFGPDAPVGYRFATQVYPLASGVLDPAIAMVAVAIYSRRATDAYNQFHDATSLQAIGRANQGFTDPVGFVMSNLAEVTSALAGYGDSVGLPPAAGTSALAGIGSGFLIAAGIGLAFWLLTR